MRDFNGSDNLFGPMSKDYCLYFYFLSIVGFIFLMLTVISSLFIGISKRKDGEYFFKMFLIALGYFIFYFQNRLLYSMCVSA